MNPPTQRAEVTSTVAFVDLHAQHREVAAEISEGVQRVMAATSFIGGQEVGVFEAAWASYTGTLSSVGVASGTDALELAIRAVGIGAGDEVVVPTNSFIASASSVMRAGAKPVFVDCDPTSYLIDPALVGGAVSSRTRAVMPVHLYGQIAPIDEVLAACGADLPLVIEDGAQSHGARRHGLRSGAWGIAAATSFYPGKNLGAYGDGGAVASNDPAVLAAVAALRNHGSEEKYEHPRLGFNSRLDTIQAVVLSAKLARLDEWNEARRTAATRYEDLLSGIDDVVTPTVLAGNEHVWHLYVIRVPDRDRVAATLRSLGVQTGIHYPKPIHLQGAFASLGYGPGDFPVAERLAGEILSLPMHPHLLPAEQERVAEALLQALR